jgi:hypothetical protein
LLLRQIYTRALLKVDYILKTPCRVVGLLVLYLQQLALLTPLENAEGVVEPNTQ